MRTVFLFIFLSLPLLALPQKPEGDIVYTEEFTPETISLQVEKPGWVYSSKSGGRKRGALKTGTSVQLVSFTDKAYFVRGKKENGIGVSGWVTPAAFSSKDPEFVSKLKQVHARQLVVRELIARQEVALGMTTGETLQVLGEPTKTKLRRNAEGQTQVWEYIEYEEISHFSTVHDPYTGLFFRKFSHTTNEEVSKIVIEFENDCINAFEVSENNGPVNPTTVAAPIIFTW